MTGGSTSIVAVFFFFDVDGFGFFGVSGGIVAGVAAGVSGGTSPSGRTNPGSAPPPLPPPLGFAGAFFFDVFADAPLFSTWPSGPSFVCTGVGWSSGSVAWIGGGTGGARGGYCGGCAW